MARPEVLLRRRDVEAKCGLSRAAITRGCPRAPFPLPVVLGPKSVAWLQSEIDRWIRDQSPSVTTARQAPNRRTIRL